MFIGLMLGILGGGGSILTVPVLVYFFNINPLKASAYSLFIVGITSLLGASVAFRKKQFSLLTALQFGIPSILAVYFTRKTLLPSLPDVIFNHGNYNLSKDQMIMMLFAFLMVVASVTMIKNNNFEKRAFSYLKVPIIILEGLMVGLLTGLVGAGGGFLIIPALVVLIGLPMKEAIGTSLAIIAAKSLIGFIGDIPNQSLDWNFLFIFSTIALIGIYGGGVLSLHLDAQKLKKGFGWFTLLAGTLILLKEFNSF